MSTQIPSQEAAKPPSFPYGAEWVRVDFHLHTKADTNEFRYAGDPAYYNSTYVDALAAADIRLGIITNHNKFDLDEFKSLRATARKKGIGLLPGIELSVFDGQAGIHVLLVFSDDWIASGNDYINAFLPTVFPGKQPSEYEKENASSEKTLLQVVEMLDGLGRDYFVICAHVEDPKGLWYEVGMGRLGAWRDKRYEQVRERVLGFQKVRSYNKLDEAGKPCRAKAKQALGDWYPAEVEGSDPKKIDEIGKGRRCHAKLGELSFEALKFALADPPARVTCEELRQRTSSCIRSVHFDGGILNGQTVHFSPELNTLIGIRGSGKSSILEAIRYVLDIPRGDKAQDARYKDELVKHTLGSGGKITLHRLRHAWSGI